MGTDHLAEKVLGWRGKEGQLTTYLYQLLEQVWGPETCLVEYPVPNTKGPRVAAIDIWSPTRKVLIEVKNPGILSNRLELTKGKEQVSAQIKGLRKRDTKGTIIGCLTDSLSWHTREYRQGKTGWRKHHILSPQRLIVFLDGLGRNGRRMTPADKQLAQSGRLYRRDGQLMKKCTFCGAIKPVSQYHKKTGAVLDLASSCKPCNNQRK